MRLSLLVLALVPVRSEEPLYKQAGAPIPARVADLIAHMTPAELLAQLQNKNEGGWDQIPNITAEYGATGIGSLFLDEMQNRSWGYYVNTARHASRMERSPEIFPFKHASIDTDLVLRRTLAQ
jgi:hypothetical protein